MISKLDLIATLQREGILYADHTNIIELVEFTFDNDLDLGFFSLSSDYRGYVKCYIEKGNVSRIEATTCESEIPDDITKISA